MIVEVLEGDEGEVVGVRFVDLYLEAKYKDNSLRNALKEVDYLS
jgi:hypothetical protein